MTGSALDNAIELDAVATLLRDAVHRLELVVEVVDRHGDRAPGALRAALDDTRQAAASARAALTTAGAAQPSVPCQAGPPGADQVEDTLELPVSVASAPTARTFVRAACARWGVTGAAAAAAVDVASELVANAVGHAWAAVTLHVQSTDDAVVVAVADDSPDLPRLLPYVPGRSEKGLGLRIVQSLSAEWGHRRTPGGKEVWAVVPRTPGRETGA